MTDPKQFHFELPDEAPPSNIQLPEVWYPNVRDYWGRCTTKRIYNPIFGMKAIVIHATDGYASSHAVTNMRDGKSSFHWLIPDEDEEQHGKIIWTCVPETLAAWHVRNSAMHPAINEGRGKCNHWSLGIEIVNRMAGGNDPFSDWQVKMTSDIVKYAWSKYPNLKHVVSHAMLDPERRTDPGSHFPWNKFKQQVLNRSYQDLLAYDNIYSAHPGIASIPSVKGDICC